MSSNSNSSYSSSSSGYDDKNLIGKTLNKKYIAIYQIGRGSFSTVWLCLNIKTKEYCAIKILYPEDFNVGMAEMELLKKLKKSKCVYINNLIDSFIYDDDEGEHSCLVFELLAGTVYDIIKYGKYSEGLPLKTVKSIIFQLLIAMNVITKDFNVLHTDIKPENILIVGTSNKLKDILAVCDKNKQLKKNPGRKTVLDLEDKFNQINKKYKNLDKTMELIPDKYIDNISVKLSDFGNCLNLEKKTFEIQTRYYRAPEIILEYDFDDKCDIWSVGCMIFELLTAKVLFDPEKERRISTNRCHVYSMISTLGKIPDELINKSKKRVDYFTKNGLPKGISEIPYDPLHTRLSPVLSGEDLNSTVNLLHLLLKYDPKQRPDIKTILNNTWFDLVRPH